MSKTVIATPWHNNKAIISLKDQTHIPGPLAWVKSTCIDRNSGCQIKQLCTKGTQIFVRNSECTGFGIHRVILNWKYSKFSRTKPFVRIQANFGIHKIRNRQYYTVPHCDKDETGQNALCDRYLTIGETSHTGALGTQCNMAWKMRFSMQCKSRQ